MTDPAGAPTPPQERQGLKLLIELGPLLVFLAAYAKFGLMTATAVLMAGSLLSIAASKIFLGHIGTTPLVTAAIVVVAGGMTLYFDDPRFIKMKPTIVNLVFAGVLGFGLMTGRYFIKMLLGEALQLTKTGWHKLTLRWIIFFLCVAVLNEIVWRTMSESTWVNFKVFGILPLTFIFAAAQIGLIKAHGASNEQSKNF